MITTVSSFVVPGLIVGISFWGLWLALKTSVKHDIGATQEQADMPISDAIDYIVNDSTAKLKQPAPPKILEFGPGKGQLASEIGVEHGDARAKVNEKLISGELRIWGRREIDTSMPNQFEHSMREIPTSYWDNMQLDFLACFSATGSASQTFHIPRKPASPGYTHLMLNKKKVREIWPPKSLWRRLRDRNKPRITYWRLGQRPDHFEELPSSNDSASPLEIIFNSTNPAKRFWSTESPRDAAGNKKPGIFWEYRVEVKNCSSKTIRNVSVTVEHIGQQLPIRPMDTIFDKIKKTTCDLKPGCSELAPIIRWPIPIKQAGMLADKSALEYGPVKVTASGDDVLPKTRLFQFDYQQTPMIFD